MGRRPAGRPARGPFGYPALAKREPRRRPGARVRPVGAAADARGIKEDRRSPMAACRKKTHGTGNKRHEPGAEIRRALPKPLPKRTGHSARVAWWALGTSVACDRNRLRPHNQAPRLQVCSQSSRLPATTKRISLSRHSSLPAYTNEPWRCNLISTSRAMQHNFTYRPRCQTAMRRASFAVSKSEYT